MKTLNLSAGISFLALETLTKPQPPQTMLEQVQHFLSQNLDIVGKFVACNLVEQRQLDQRMQLQQYELCYEHQTLRFQFMFFQPRGTWQLQGFRFLK